MLLKREIIIKFYFNSRTNRKKKTKNLFVTGICVLGFERKLTAENSKSFFLFLNVAYKNGDTVDYA